MPRRAWIAGFFAVAGAAAAVAAEPAPERLMDIIDEGTVFRDGVRYRRFGQGGVSILVPTFWNLSAEDFERATCADRVEGNVGRERSAATVEATVTVEVKAYAELIQQTIRTRCRGDRAPVRVPIDPHLDLGVSFSAGKGRGKPKDAKVRVFNRDLGSNLNLGIDF
jgi:hypothetical protein